jgi:hypothetical protein
MTFNEANTFEAFVREVRSVGLHHTSCLMRGMKHA